MALSNAQRQARYRARHRQAISEKRKAKRQPGRTRESAPARPSALADWLATLTVGDGRYAGQPFKVLDWQRRFVAEAIEGQATTGALSLARGNGKTAAIAAVAAAAVAGPLARPRGQVLCMASSHAQGLILFEDVLGYLRPWLEAEPGRYRVLNSMSAALVEDTFTGSRLRVLGCDSKRALGLRPYLALLDEPSAWPPASRDSMYQALRTALGKVPDSKLVALGTRPHDGQGHWFGRLLNTADVAHCYAVGGDVEDVTLETHWREANPSADHLTDLAVRIREEAEEARQDVAALAAFRAYRCNQGTADVERDLVVDAAKWRACERLGEGEAAGPFALGVDLGQSHAMSAAAGYWPDTGRLDAFALFAGADMDLAERGRRDGVGSLYLDMERRGELFTTTTPDVPAELLLRMAAERWGHPNAIAADRWREAELRAALDEAAYPMVPFAGRGQGFKDGAEDVRTFRRAIGRGRVRPGVSLLLRSAVSEAVLLVDAAGNAKLAKGSQGGRRARAKDDALAAAILAVAEAVRQEAGG